jgi:peptidoglycan/LPS O-acetylase OafA/YrhL
LGASEVQDPVRAGGALQWGALTGIRGIAAWYVVLFHTRAALHGTLPDWMLLIANKGYLAVDLFFILSGFVLWHTYGEKLRGTGLAGAARFWWRRIARIWPLHIAILAVFIALAALLQATGRDTSMYPWAELPLHILLVQNWGFTSHLAWNDPAWSISCEMAAYVAFPLIVAIAPWSRMRTGTLVAVAGLLLAAICFYFAVQGGGTLGADVANAGLMRCLLEFWVGNVLRLLWERWRHVPNAAIGAWAAMITLLEGGVVLGLPETAYIPACFVALILALALDDGIPARLPTRLLGSRPLAYLGEISYSTYLVHFLLFVLFKLAFVHSSALGRPQIGRVQLAAYLGIVLVASIVLYHGLEKPAQRWMNGFIARDRRALQAAVAE